MGVSSNFVGCSTSLAGKWPELLKLAMNCRQRAGRQYQSAVAGARESRDAALDLTGIAHIDRGQLNAKRRRHGLDRAELACAG